MANKLDSFVEWVQSRDHYISLLVVVLLSAINALAGTLELSIGLVDFYGQATFAQGFAVNGAWPATPYYPAGYPLLLAPFGLLGNVLFGGYMLSAIGYLLMLVAIRRLGILWGIPDLPLAGLLYLLSASFLVEICFDSPAVDGLFTGLALLFVVTVLVLWNKAVAASAPWAMLTMIVCSAALPLLRYHALIVVVPLLLVMLLFRPAARRTAVLALLACICAIAMNAGVYAMQYGVPLQTAAGLQVRCGLEFDLRKNYASPDELFADYENFASQARSTPLLEAYSPAEIARHSLQSFSRFLRRPAILLAIGIFALLVVLKRSKPQAGGLLLIWLILYCVALSPAYYTDRAALLPVILAATLCYAMLPHLARGGKLLWSVAAVIVLLSVGGFLTSESYLRESSLRRLSISRSADLAQVLKTKMIDRRTVASSDMRLLPLEDNSWCEPYVTLEQSWLDDPLIHPEQKPGMRRTGLEQIASGTSGLEKLVIPLDDNGKVPPRVKEYADLLGFKEEFFNRENWLLVLDVPLPEDEFTGQPIYIDREGQVW